MNERLVIDVEGLSKTYQDGRFRRRAVEALRGVSLQVPRGEIFGLLGPNGAGKTTLIKILLGIVRKTSGAARMLDRPAGDRIARRQVGYLPEHPRIPRHLTGETAMEYYGSLSGLSLAEIKRRRPDVLSLVNLGRWSKTLVKKYSKGMLQRLTLAQAMLHDPELLILDEPTDGVDPVGRAEIRGILKQLKQQGKTVFLNSHLLQEVELVCDRVAILDRGQVRLLGGVQEITQRFSAQAAMELRLELKGDEWAVRTALGSHEPSTWQVAGDGQFQVGVLVNEQADVDQLVDALRSGQVSICSMSRRRSTLEEAFLQILQQGAEP